MIDITNWSSQQLFSAVEKRGQETFVQHFGKPDQWDSKTTEVVRGYVQLRVNARKVCACGGHKAPQAPRCKACHGLSQRLPDVLCAGCGKQIRAGRITKKYCSLECYGKAISLPDTEFRLRLRVRRADASRRRVAKGWKPSKGRWRLICERDRWTCWVCGGAIDKALVPPHRLSGSMDHVIRLADGGGDDDDNLRAAHLTCNVRRRSLTRLAVPDGVISNG